MKQKLTIERLGLDEANAFVKAHHRHHMPVIGHLFSIGAALGDKIVGIVIVGRPVSRMRDDGMTAEVTRLCTDGTRNACSFLYGAAARCSGLHSRMGRNGPLPVRGDSASWTPEAIAALRALERAGHEMAWR
jgi:hypothetical protein